MVTFDSTFAVLCQTTEIVQGKVWPIRKLGLTYYLYVCVITQRKPPSDYLAKLKEIDDIANNYELIVE